MLVQFAVAIGIPGAVVVPALALGIVKAGSPFNARFWRS